MAVSTAHWDHGPAIVAVALDVARKVRPTTWLDAWAGRQIAAEVRRHGARPRARCIAAQSGVTERVNARAVVRRACVASALTGAAAGAVSTGATVATAETQGLASLLTVPAAVLSVGAEAILRLRRHVRMICDIADLFGLRFDPDAPAEVWALLSLTYGVGVSDESPGARLLGVARLDAEAISKQIGARLAGESVARNLVPFLDVVSSSATNWVLTRRLGDTVRRYARYRRAFDEALAADEALVRHLDLLVAGAWFLFVADGPATPEETALMASLVCRCEPPLEARLDELLADEITWVARLPEIPWPSRPAFLHVLEVAAAVDKRASLRERKLLGHAARALGLEHDETRVDRMIEDLEDVGVLCCEQTAPRGRRAEGG